MANNIMKSMYGDTNTSSDEKEKKKNTFIAGQIPQYVMLAFEMKLVDQGIRPRERQNVFRKLINDYISSKEVN